VRDRSISLAIAGAAVVVAMAAPVASANSVDDAFIAAIDGYPVTYSTAENAIALAHTVCDYLAAGQTSEAVAVEIGQPANWTVAQSVFFVQSSTHSYCPGPVTTPATAAQAVPPIIQAPAPVVSAPAPLYPQVPIPTSSYYANCSAARGAHAAPLYAGQPGYRSALDRDGDGVACE
jgi:hypothetical protein